jgi:hypothetical protein
MEFLFAALVRIDVTEDHIHQGDNNRQAGTASSNYQPKQAAKIYQKGSVCMEYKIEDG